MRILTYTAERDFNNIKQVIRKHLNISSALLTRVKNSGGIKINGEQVTVRHGIRSGQTLTVEIPVDACNIKPVSGNLDIIYEDEDILCVNKPCGMPTHPSQNHYDDTLANIVTYYLKDTDSSFHAVNRLDAYTSGVVVIAKNAYSASVLSGNLSDFLFDKKYVALCNGVFSQKQGRVIAPISRAEGSTIKRCVSEKGRYAETIYKVLFEANGKSLVELMPITGRTHQIRVHMAFIGHSLVNDFLYDLQADDTVPFKLHCKSISLIHPFTRKKIVINSTYDVSKWLEYNE